MATVYIVVEEWSHNNERGSTDVRKVFNSAEAANKFILKKLEDYKMDKSIKLLCEGWRINEFVMVEYQYRYEHIDSDVHRVEYMVYPMEVED